MARYFLHLRDGNDEVLDSEGVEYATLDAVRKAVIANVRDIAAGQIKDAGVLDLRFRIDAEDEAGTVLYSLPFAEALSVLSPDAQPA